MRSIRITHIIDFENRNIWFEEYLTMLSEYGIKQEVVAIKKNPYLRSFCQENTIFFGSGTYYIFYSILQILRGGKSDFLLSHGYKPSLFAQFIGKVFVTRFIVIHHHQPNFFNLLRLRSHFVGTFHSRIAKISYRSSFAIQAFSGEVSRALHDYGIPQAKIFLNPIGINLKSLQYYASFSRQESVSNKLEKNVISISRLSWEKNLHLAIEAIALANQMGERIQYSIYGSGPERESLIKLIKYCKAEEFIHLKGFESEVLSKMQAADLFLHTSLTESYGQAIFEALYLGTPILSSSVGISLDLAKIYGPRIQLISDYSPNGLANQMITMLNGDYTNQPLNEVEVASLQEHSMSSSVFNLVTFLNNSLGPSSKYRK